MEEIIKIHNNIQMSLGPAHLKYDLNIARIVVIGGQSSGKSSVLESIAGFDFLPKGANMVTKCPLTIQLVYHNIIKPYAIFSHKEKKFYKFDEVRTEIEERTKELVGESKTVVNKPIYLTIYSKDVPTLTLIDLPGIVKNQLENQDNEVVEDIESLAMEYIRKDNTIILAVSQANVHIANSDALKLAKKVDPQRKRTIGVLTKIDIMDKGTDALDCLTGKDYHLELGFVGVKCRSQQDNDDGKSIQECTRFLLSGLKMKKFGENKNGLKSTKQRKI